jgi:hypothetical protein
VPPSAREQKELMLLTALDVYGTWHSTGWLAGHGLIDANWAPDDVIRHLDGLARAGDAERRFSPTRRIPMYKITEEGVLRLGPGHQDRVAAASEEPVYVRTPGPAEWEPPGRLVCTSGSGFSRRGAP